MNTIQLISHHLESRKLKLQMDLDPAADIDTHKLRAMWRQMNFERLRQKENGVSNQGTTG